ncbi:unnamed protein product [Arabidopsis thaliana]|uniref:(thale cress) hypothetical protein n=1 Tax=Arabidopsis thaliana TaxID=3702 RepID=A0A7G2F1Y7_ARATH|nr:unnamed protein product [Arabidopsis thaliana]
MVSFTVAINAMWMQTYIGGVSCPYVCSKSQDHGVLLVGFGSPGYAPIRLKEKPYWIIKNSWGAMWGEYGYYKICRGPHNMCGILVWIQWYLLLLLFIPYPSRIIRTLLVCPCVYVCMVA